MKKLFIFILLLSVFNCSGKELFSASRYRFNLQINPEDESISVKLQLNYVHNSGPSDTLCFYLHKNMEIESLACENLRSWYSDSSNLKFIPEAKKLVFILDQKIEKGQDLKIKLSYHGKVGIIEPWENNRVTKDWIEMGNYIPWFLYSPDINEMTYKGVVELDNDYILASNAYVKGKSRKHLTTKIPQNDIVIAASKDFKVVKKKDNPYEINIYHLNLSDTVADKIAQSAINILTKCEEWFGKTNSTRNTIYIPTRTNGGGYARQGILCLSNINDFDYLNKQVDYMRYFAHEFSHLWWYKADVNTWEDWLNESFAEFTALMMIRENFGENEFQQRLAVKKQNMDQLPSVFKIDRSDKFAFQVLYNKGCVILSFLENEIGRDNFIKLLNDMHKLNIHTTSTLISYIETHFGSSASEKLSGWLKK